jgi:hypothetical protein
MDWLADWLNRYGSAVQAIAAIAPLVVTIALVLVAVLVADAGASQSRARRGASGNGMLTSS